MKTLPRIITSTPRYFFLEQLESIEVSKSEYYKSCNKFRSKEIRYYYSENEWLTNLKY